MKQIPVLLLLGCLLATPVMAKTLSKIAAVVNDNIISTFQLNQAVAEAEANDRNGSQQTPAQLEKLRKQVLDKLIDDELINQQIKELHMTVSDGELNAAIDDIKRKNHLTDETLKKALAAQGMTLKGYKKKFRQQILHYKLIRHEVNYKVLVTDKEIRDYYQKHLDQYQTNAKVQLSHISYQIPPNADADTLAKIRKQAEVTRDLLLEGKPFDQVLKAQGAGATGGDMGTLAETDLAKPLRKALSGLKVGQVTQPLMMNNQLHLFLVTKRDTDGNLPLEKVKADIENTLRQEKSQARFKAWTKELRDKSHIEIRI